MPRGRPKGSGRKGLYRRYSLVLPLAFFEEIYTVVSEMRCTVQAALETLITKGLILYKASQAGDPIIIRKDGKDREVILP